MKNNLIKFFLNVYLEDIDNQFDIELPNDIPDNDDDKPPGKQTAI